MNPASILTPVLQGWQPVSQREGQRTQEKREAKHEMTGQGATKASQNTHQGWGAPQDRLTKAARNVTLYPATDRAPLHPTESPKQSHPCLLTAGDADGDLLHLQAAQKMLSAVSGPTS